MYVLVDLETTPAGVSLQEPQDCGRFRMAVRGVDSVALGRVLAATATGWLLSTGGGEEELGEAYVWIDAVRRMSVGRVGESWDSDLSGMVSYARSKGWLSQDEKAIRAHIELSR